MSTSYTLTVADVKKLFQQIDYTAIFALWETLYLSFEVGMDLLVMVVVSDSIAGRVRQVHIQVPS